MNISREHLYSGQIVPIDKPVNWTSFDVVNKLRSVSKIRKVGHAGTLDPFATGLLLVCFAKATKSVEKLMGLPKEYIARFKFGVETDSHDITGKVVQEFAPIDLTIDRLEAVLKNYRGEIEQIPPMYSALKVRGKKLYEYAREGKTIIREPRPVTIYELTVLELNNDECVLKICCSKGTYIRSLARDIGRDLKSGAFISELRRTRIGDYHIDSAFKIEDFISALKENKPSNECLSRD
ncbi:MAG: tRNA pseudouridine(55) synthase TruB [Calditrichaeota bacterium]|nr:MAG: tRNA pseudouridine(55) synthase TruB [Calditrichota bacterium]